MTWLHVTNPTARSPVRATLISGLLNFAPEGISSIRGMQLVSPVVQVGMPQR